MGEQCDDFWGGPALILAYLKRPGCKSAWELVLMTGEQQDEYYRYAKENFPPRFSYDAVSTITGYNPFTDTAIVVDE